MNNDIFPKVKIIMNQATVVAKTFDDIEIKPEHILLSILQDDDNACTQVFEKLKVNTEELHDKVSQYLRDTDLTPRVGSKKGKLPFSKDMKLIIKTIDSECEKLNDSIIDTTHLMLGILRAEIPVNSHLSREGGVTYNSFLKIMKDMGNKENKNSAFSGDDEEQDDLNKSMRNFKKPTTNDSKSKTPVLDNFCRDVSKAVERGEIDPVVGRKVEIKRVSQILST